MGITVAIDTVGTVQGYVVTADGIDVNGDPSGSLRYWSGPMDGGRLLTEQATEVAARAMAVNFPLDGRLDLPEVIECRVIRAYHRSIDGNPYTIRELYPRRLVQADDVETESLTALHIRAGSITADRLDVNQLSAITADCGTLTAGVIDGVVIYAGGGQEVLLDLTGISTEISTSVDDARAYKFTNAGAISGGLYGFVSGGIHETSVRSLSLTGLDSQVDIIAAASSLQNAKIILQAFSGGSSVTATLNAQANTMTITSDVIVQSGLNVGSATGAATGQIKASGTIQPGNVAVSYTANYNVSLANNGVMALGMSNFGFAKLWAGGNVAEFRIDGSSHATAELSDPGGIFSATAGTASSINVYWSAGNSRYEIENKRGSAIVVRAWLLDAA